MKTDIQLTKSIMRRVYVVFWVRRLTQPKVRVAVFAGIILAVASSVSLPNIISNALHTSDIVGFSMTALTDTTLAIQLGVLAAGLILLASVFELVRPRNLQLS